MAAQVDDMLVVTIQVNYPAWLDELNEEEFENVMVSAEVKATEAFVSKLREVNAFWLARKAASMAGQTDIYDYV